MNTFPMEEKNSLSYIANAMAAGIFGDETNQDIRNIAIISRNIPFKLLKVFINIHFSKNLILIHLFFVQPEFEKGHSLTNISSSKNQQQILIKLKNTSTELCIRLVPYCVFCGYVVTECFYFRNNIKYCG